MSGAAAPVGGTILERVAEWAATLSLDDIPSSVQERVRLQILSMVSAAAASPWHEPSLAVERARRRPGEELVFATGSRLQPLDAAFTNAAFAMSLDFDDYMLSGHTGYSSVLVPLALCSSLDEAVVCCAAANELMGRLSTACIFGPVNGQMSSYIHNAGAALAAGKALGLTAAQLAAAVAISLYQPNLCLGAGFWEEGAKTVTSAQPLEQGVRAAELAAAGLTGPVGILEHGLGFLEAFSFARFPGLFDGLGGVWFSETLSYKRYPGTSYISAAVEAALRLTGGEPLAPSDIESVEIETTVLSATLDAAGAAAIEREPLDANAVNFSLRLSVAVALASGELGPDELRPEVLARSAGRIREIAAKIRVVHDWSQTARLFASTDVGMRMLLHLGSRGALRTVAHARRMSGASGAAERPGNRLRGLPLALADLVPALVRASARPVAALDFDPRSFRMLQSARVRLASSAARGAEFVEIPVGACGRPFEEAREVVAHRVRQAFGDGVERVMGVALSPGASVADLYGAAAEPAASGAGGLAHFRYERSPGAR